MRDTPPKVTLPQKLGIKPGYTMCVLNPPDSFMEMFASEMSQARIVRGLEPDADIICAFVSRKHDLETSFPRLKAQLGKPHALWISWPKKNSDVVSDLNENIVRDIGLNNGLVDVKVCAINDTWSGLKFVYRLQDR